MSMSSSSEGSAGLRAAALELLDPKALPSRGGTVSTTSSSYLVLLSIYITRRLRGLLNDQAPITTGTSPLRMPRYFYVNKVCCKR